MAVHMQNAVRGGRRASGPSVATRWRVNEYLRE